MTAAEPALLDVRRVSGRTLWPSLFTAVVLIVPAFVLPLLRLGDAVDVIAAATAVLGVNLIVGHAGQVALGHAAFVGVGAYTSVILSADHGWPLLATVPAAAFVAFVLGMLVGLPALRISGLYLALITLTVGAAFGPVVKRLDHLTGGTSGKGTPAELIAPSWFGTSRLATARWRYLVVALMAVVVLSLARNLVNGRIGRSLVALREDELGALCFGVPVRRTKLLMFGLSAAVAAIGGAMLVIRQPFVVDTNFSQSLSIKLYTAGFLGGIASVSGSLVGGLVMVAVPLLFAQLGWTLEPNLVFGAALVLLTLLAPDGVAGVPVAVRARLLPKRR